MNTSTYNEPFVNFAENRLWQEATIPNIRLLKQLAIEIKNEIESINDSGRIDFGEGIDLSEQVQKFEVNMIRHALYLCRGRQAEAAKMLGIKKTTLNAKIKRFQMML